MIQLLSPEEVKKGPSRAVEEQRGVVRDLASEEIRLVLSVNTLRQDEIDEKARIREDVAQFRNEAQVEITGLDTQIASKKREVESLEIRRTEAMKPIEEVQKEADERNEKSKEREASLDKREETLRASEEVHVAALEKAHDHVQDISEREEDVVVREQRASQEETKLKNSANSLNAKWAEYHEAVAAKNTEIEQREAAVRAGEETNKIRATELEKIAEAQKEKDRQLVDKYATLESAKRELLQGEKGSD